MEENKALDPDDIGLLYTNAGGLCTNYRTRLFEIFACILSRERGLTDMAIYHLSNSLPVM